MAAQASARLGLKAHATFSGALAWPYFYPWPPHNQPLLDEAFDELARRWRPLLDVFDEQGVDVCYEIHPGEAVEEKVSLSERFGLWLSFYPFDQDAYLAAVAVWLQHFGLEPDPEAEAAALLWARLRGARSGRIAWQFACDWAGRTPEERTALSL